MNLKNVEKKEKNTVELTIEVGAAEFDAAIDKVYKKQRGSISIPGFRKGKAPRKIIEGMYDSGVFYEDAINDLYPDTLAAAVKEAGLDMVGYPKVEMETVGKEGFTFKATIAVRPEVKLGEYKGVSTPKESVEVTDEDVEKELKPYVDRATRLVSVEREAKTGDTVVMDFEGFKDGVPFEGGKAEKYSLELGSNSFVPGFEDQLIGVKAGDEKSLDITFPENYTPELAGQAVVFQVKVHEVKEPELPVVDDEFAKDVSEFDTLEEFKNDLAAKLKERRESESKRHFEDAVLAKVVENMECEIPDAMVEYEADKMVEDYANRINTQAMGITFESYLQMMGTNINELRANAMTSAGKQVANQLALAAVADAEDIQVTDEDKEAEIKRMAELYGMTEEKIKSAVPDEEIVRELRLTKAMKLIVDAAVATEAAAEGGEEKKAAKKPARKPAKKAEGAEDGEKKPAKRTAKKAAKEEEKEEEAAKTEE